MRRIRIDEAELQKANETATIAPGTRRVSGLGSANAQTMVEFILVLPLFLFLVFAVFDYGRLFLTQMNVEHAIQDAGRFASTGNHLADPKNPGQNLSRVNSIILAAQRAAFDAKITNVQISSLNGGSGSAGGPGDTVTVSVTTDLQLMTPFVARLFPNGKFTFTSSATFKNEPFPPGNTK